MSMANDDRVQIVETTIRVGWYADHRQWTRLFELFAESVVLDYTSMLGGEPTTVSRAGVATTWESTLGGLDTTQHLITNHLVGIELDRAEVTAQFVATHVLTDAEGGSIWTLGGNYRWRLVFEDKHWQITAMTMTPSWNTGNTELLRIAAARRAANTPQ